MSKFSYILPCSTVVSWLPGRVLFTKQCMQESLQIIWRRLIRAIIICPYESSSNYLCFDNVVPYSYGHGELLRRPWHCIALINTCLSNSVSLLKLCVTRNYNIKKYTWPTAASRAARTAGACAALVALHAFFRLRFHRDERGRVARDVFDKNQSQRCDSIGRDDAISYQTHPSLRIPEPPCRTLLYRPLRTRLASCLWSVSGCRFVPNVLEQIIPQAPQYTK